MKLAIRPFRSNDDLLQALKRRQQNTKSAKKVASFKPAADEENEEELQKGVPSPSTLPVHSQRSKFEKNTIRAKYLIQAKKNLYNQQMLVNGLVEPNRV